MNTKYDVVIIGAGPAGLHTSIILKKGTPMQVPNEPIKVAVVEAAKIGGLTQYAFIQITKKWAFSGNTLINTLYNEAVEGKVDFFKKTVVRKIKREKNGYFQLITNKETITAKYVVIATGILTFPTVLDTPKKTNIGLHTPEEMAKEVSNDYGWKNILVVGSNEHSIKNLSNRLKALKIFNQVDYEALSSQMTIEDRCYGLSKEKINAYDGILFDYNSYKLQNGSTYFLHDLNILQKNGFIKTNKFGETIVPGLFAVGSVTKPISGVPQAIYSGQVTGLYIGHLLEKTTIADPSGRFPFLPREENWKESFQHELEIEDS